MLEQHNKIINAAAKKILAPEGLFRVGSSRTWIDDNGYFVIQVEFQPSSYDRGSYLNVGISFLWETSERLNETLAFNIGYRVNKVGYASYRGNDAAYEKKMEDFAEAAMEKVREYSMLFMVIIILVRPISSYSEISVFESSVALLAGVFMADNYYMEYMNDRISTYYLFPFKKKCTSLLKRIVISQVYLIALIAVFYWGFVLMYHPTNYSGVSIAVLYIQCVCACAASMFFMGILCFTATNLLRNIGIGIGCVFLLWLFLTSSITRILPQLLQLTIFGGFAPQSTSAETLSKALGSRTVMSGSVSRSKNDPSESLQMIERPLMTPDELKSMPKGQFVVMKTGFYPMKVKLKLFFKWGIQFDEKNPYAVADQGNRKVEYASKKDIMDGIVKKYRLDLLAPPEPADEGNASGGQDQAKDESSQPQTKKQQTRDKKKTGGSNLQTSPRARRTPPQEPKPEVSANGQT